MEKPDVDNGARLDVGRKQEKAKRRIDFVEERRDKRAQQLRVIKSL